MNYRSDKYGNQISILGFGCMRFAQQKGIPVIIMEPLRGGKLVNRLPQEALNIFADYKTQHTPAQWAFRWLWNQPEVTCVLSGMNSDEMVQDNIQTASTVAVGELGPDEEAMLKGVVKAINAKMKVGCTGCGKCEQHCPQYIEIRKELKNASKELEGPIYRMVRRIVKLFKIF